MNEESKIEPEHIKKIIKPHIMKQLPEPQFRKPSIISTIFNIIPISLK